MAENKPNKSTQPAKKGAKTTESKKTKVEIHQPNKVDESTPTRVTPVEEKITWRKILINVGKALLLFIVLLLTIVIALWAFGKIRQQTQQQSQPVQPAQQSQQPVQPAQQSQQPVQPAQQSQQPVQPAQQQQSDATWSAYGEPSFIVTDGQETKTGSDVFTDPKQGSLKLDVKPTEPTCLLQFGVTTVFTEPFSANFVSGDTGAGFRIIAKQYWSQLPQSDGAYSLCWNR